MRDVHRIARWALLLAVALVPLLMSSPALAGTFVYVGNADSNEIYVLRGRPALPQTGRQHVAHYLWWPQRDPHRGLVIPFEGLALAA
jgi:hypothetical protein